MPVVLQTAGLLMLSNLYMRQPFKLYYLWASFCILGAVYFVFRQH